MPDRAAAFTRFGWMGVDLFFVLSGYLIGSQLLKSYRSGERPRLWDFYRRRLYRILPAYLTVLALYFLVPVWREQDGISPLWQFLTFTENFFVDYAKNEAFSHVWSLCVEEHFYLLLPLLMLWLTRKAALWKTVSVLAFFVAFGIGIRWYVLLHVLRPMGVGNDDFGVTYIERVYYPTYTRLDGLLAGVALALIRTFRPLWWAALARRGHALFIAGLALVGISAWLFANRFESVTGATAAGTVVGFPLLSLGLGLVVASSISANGWLAKVRIPGATLMATLAFSLYLTHKEAVHLDQRYLPRIVEAGLWPSLLLYAVSCLAVAGTLYLCVERPFLILRDRRAGRRVSKPELAAVKEPAL